MIKTKIHIQTFLFLIYGVLTPINIIYIPLYLYQNNYTNIELAILLSSVSLGYLFSMFVSKIITINKFIVILSTIMSILLLFFSLKFYNIYYIFLISFFFFGLFSAIGRTYYDKIILDVYDSNYGKIRMMGTVYFFIINYLYYTYSQWIENNMYVIYLFVSFVFFIYLITFSQSKSKIIIEKMIFDKKVVTENKLLYLEVFIYYLSLCITLIYTSIYLMSLNFSKEYIGELWNISIFSEIVALLVISYIIKKIDNKVIINILYILLILRGLFLTYMYDNEIILIFSMLLYGIMYGWYHPIKLKELQANKNSLFAIQFYVAISFGLSMFLASYFIYILNINKMMLLSSVLFLLSYFIYIYRMYIERKNN